MFAKIALIAFFVSVGYANVQNGDVRFFLTNSNTRTQEFTTSTISGLGLDNTKKVKIIAHGWVDDITASWYPCIANNYLIRGDSNVIIALDWSKYAFALYSTSVDKLPDIAGLTASMILDLKNTYNIPLGNFHLIGHSLGAQLFGFVGQYVFTATGERIGRITGLDPAGVSYNGNPPDQRISPDDAEFVDIIHTDSNGVGTSESVGDVDYFPNGGVSRQNGCGILQLGCSHNRAPLYFCESITSDGFVTVACDNVKNFNSGSCNNNRRTVMGEDVDQTARGNFFLNTASSSPFALGRL